jgi:hypothetical protein
MASATITELPLRLHRVERDPFIDSTLRGRTDRGDAGGTRDLTTAALAELAVDLGELRLRGRQAELAA